MFCIKMKFAYSTQEQTEAEPELWIDKMCQTHHGWR